MSESVETLSWKWFQRTFILSKAAQPVRYDIKSLVSKHQLAISHGMGIKRSKEKAVPNLGTAYAFGHMVCVVSQNVGSAGVFGLLSRSRKG